MHKRLALLRCAIVARLVTADFHAIKSDCKVRIPAQMVQNNPSHGAFCPFANVDVDCIQENVQGLDESLETRDIRAQPLHCTKELLKLATSLRAVQIHGCVHARGVVANPVWR